MNYNPTPRSEYVKSAERVKAHHTLVENDTFRLAITTALMEYNRRLTSNPPPEMGGAASSYLRLLGASEFVEILMNLTEVKELATRVDTGNLAGNITTLPTSKKG